MAARPADALGVDPVDVWIVDEMARHLTEAANKARLYGMQDVWIRLLNAARGDAEQETLDRLRHLPIETAPDYEVG